MGWKGLQSRSLLDEGYAMLSSLHASSFVALISCRGTWCHRRVSGVNEFLDLVRGQRCEVSCGAYPFGDPYGWPPPMTSCNYIVSYVVKCSFSSASRARVASFNICGMLGVYARPLHRCERLIPLVEKNTFLTSGVPFGKKCKV